MKKGERENEMKKLGGKKKKNYECSLQARKCYKHLCFKAIQMKSK